MDGRTAIFDLCFDMTVSENSPDDDGDDVKLVSAESKGEEAGATSTPKLHDVPSAEG